MSALTYLISLTPMLMTFVGYFVGAVFAVLYFINQGARDRRRESDELADNLIKRLQETVDAQTKDLATMHANMENHTRTRDAEVQTLRDQINHIQGRNSVLEDLFKGRDPAMQAFLKDAPELIQIAKGNNSLGKANGEAITELTKTFAKFINTLQPILIHLETARVK